MEHLGYGSRDRGRALAGVESVLAPVEGWVKAHFPGMGAREIEQLYRYGALLYHWSARLSLIAPRDREVLVEKHLVPALKIGAVIRGLPHKRIMDWGSGGGLPGIPLKIMLQDTEVLLVEARRRRANFLREVVRQLKLVGIEVVNKRLEMEEPIGERADVVVSRAVARPEKLIEMVRPYLKPHGVVITTLGPSYPKPEGRVLLLATREGAWQKGRMHIGVLR